MVLLSFFMCRILVFPFMYWMYGQQFGIPLHRVAFHLPLQCNVGNVVILAPQIYWFILLLRKANRLYLRQRRGKGKGNESSPKTDWRVNLCCKFLRKSLNILQKIGNSFRQFLNYERKEVNIYNLKEKMYFFKNAFAPAIAVARCIVFGLSICMSVPSSRT